MTAILIAKFLPSILMVLMAVITGLSVFFGIKTSKAAAVKVANAQSDAATAKAIAETKQVDVQQAATVEVEASHQAAIATATTLKVAKDETTKVTNLPTDAASSELLNEFSRD